MESLHTYSWTYALPHLLCGKEKYHYLLSVKRLAFLFVFLCCCISTQSLSAQACGSCASANCTAVKQYTNKAAAQAGLGKIWTYYTPVLTSTAGTFTVYATVTTDMWGQVSVMQEFQIRGASAGLTAKAQAIAATRTYMLYALSDVNCTSGFLPANIANDGSSTTFNPAWTNLSPNTNYKLALTTNLSSLGAYTYEGFNIRFYHAVRTVATFTFNCGAASASGTFTANGVANQTGTLNVPISSATAGSATFNVSGTGFTGSVTTNIAVGQTSVSVPITYDGTGAVGSRTLTVTSIQGTGACTPSVTVGLQLSTFAFNCGTASTTGTFTANSVTGQSGTITIPLSNTTAGQATFSVSGGGFSGSTTSTLTAGQTSVTFPISYNGSGAAGNHLVSITSPNGTGTCALTINVLAPVASYTFNCATASVSGNFIANNATGQGGFVTVPITSATAGTTTMTVTGTGITGTLTTILTANQTQVTIPITYDGSGIAGARPLSITSPQGSGTCAPVATVAAATTAGAITFNCSATAATVGTFTANGATQTGLMSVNFTTQTAGQITLTVSGGGFSGTYSGAVSAGQTSVTMSITYNGSGVAGNHAVTVASSQATGSCAMNIPVNALFAFACGNANTASNFTANGTSQNGTLVIPLSNVASGSATFSVSGNGFTGSLTTTLQDSQRFVAIPVVYDGSGAVGGHAVTVTSAQGSGSCSINVIVKDPAMNGCDYLVGQSVTFGINSQTTYTGYSTSYILVDAGGIIRYSTSTLPFTGVAIGEYEGYAVNYSGTAPTLTVGTSLASIGGSCANLSNALPVKMCAAYQFNCGSGTYTGVFIANATGGQTGTITISVINALPISTTISIASGGFTGSVTQTLTSGTNTITIPVTYDGSGAGGVRSLTITGTNASGTCAVGVDILPPPPASNFAFTCASATINGTFIADNSLQSGSVTINLTGVVVGTTDFTISGTGFSGGLTNVVLTAGQTSITIPVDYTGQGPAGTYAITINSPKATATCNTNVVVLPPCLTGATAPSVTPTTASNTCPATTINLTTLPQTVTVPTGTTVIWSTSRLPTTAADTLTTAQATAVSTAGKYYALFYDKVANCYSPADSVTVTINAIPSAPTTTVTQPTCSVTTGTITVNTPSSGVTYSFDNGTTYQASNIKSGLASGTYQVLAKDNTSNCVSTATPSVISAQPTTPVISSVAKTDPSVSSCPTLNDGTITVTATGSNLQYSKDNGAIWQASNQFTGLSAGSYTIKVRNSVSTCEITYTSNPVVLTAPVCCATPSVGGTTATTTPAVCTMTNNGTITLSGQTGAVVKWQTSTNGGTLWTDIAHTSTTYNFTNAANNQQYRAVVNNSGGCVDANSSATTITVNPLPSAPTATVSTQPTCATATASVSLSGLPSTGTWTLTRLNTTTLATFVVTTSGSGSTFSYSNVPTGTYTYTVKNNTTNCESTASNAITVNAQPTTPSVPTLTLTQPTCSVSTGTITVNTPTETGMTYSINGSTYTNTTGVFNNIPSGTYSVTAKTINGCLSPSASATINAVISTPIVTITQPTCNTSTGSFTVTSPVGAGLSYSIDGVDYSNTSGVFSNLAVGTYNVTAKNGSGCVSPQTTVLINSPVPTPVIAVNQPNCTTATGTITITSPTSGVTYSFDNGTTFAATNIKSNAAAGMYQIVIQNNTNSCQSSPISVKVNAAPTTGCSCNNTTGRLTSPNTNQNTSAAYTQKYALTTNDGVMLQISNSPSFTGLMSGQYAIYGINYETAKGVNGLTVGQNVAGVNGDNLDVSEPTFYTVCRPVYSCNNTSGTLAPTITGQNAQSNYTQRYALTDTEGVILSVSTTPLFTGLDNGRYQVFAVNYETANGATGLTVTQNINDVTGACLNISTPLYYQVCLPPYACNNASGNITARVSGQNTNPSYTQSYALTDSAGLILRLATTPSFTGLTDGKYKVYAVNYETSSGVTGLTVGQNIDAVTGSCFAKSSPLRYQVCLMPEICNNKLDDDGDGLIDCEDPDCTSCGCDNTTGTVTFTNTGAATTGYTQIYVLTDSTATVLQLTNTLTFNNLASGRYRIYAVNHRTNDSIYGLKIGADLDTLNGTCFDKSLPLLFKVCRAGTALRHSVEVSASTVCLNGVTDYTLIVRNTGTITANNITITDTLATGLKYLVDTVQLTGGAIYTPSVFPTANATGILNWNKFTIPAGDSVIITVIVTVDNNATIGTYHNGLGSISVVDSIYPYVGNLGTNTTDDLTISNIGDCLNGSQPIACSPSFYQIYTANRSTNFALLNVQTSSYTLVGSGPRGMNAIGINEKTSYGYGVINTANVTQFIKIGANNTVFNTGISLGAPAIIAGDCDTSGYWWSKHGTQFLRIKLDDMTQTRFTPTGSAGWGADMVFRRTNQQFYSVNGNTLYNYDPLSNNVSVIALTGAATTNGSGTYGGQWAGADGDMYISSNVTGKIYKVDLNSGATTLTLNATGGLAVNDGYYCPDAIAALSCTALDLKVFLEGPFQTGTSTMHTALNQRGLLPGQTPIGQFAVTTPAGQPYKGAPWNYAGTEGDTITTYPSTVVDWVLVSLRSDSTTSTSLFRVTGWLHSDGHISFLSPCFTLTNGAYFIVIEHRNHVGVMSSNKALVRNNILTYDFTTTDSYVKTNPPSFGQKLKGTKWTMYAGDGKKNDYINNYDINFSDSFLWKGESGIFDRYKLGDFDMNADVNFLDSYLWKLNSGKYSAVPH